jgi:hypothetical protein
MPHIDLDTVIIVEADGTDTEYNIKDHPGMSASIMESMSPDVELLWITIPIKKKVS